jgi:hypothetical protein
MLMDLFLYFNKLHFYYEKFPKRGFVLPQPPGSPFHEDE